MISKFLLPFLHYKYLLQQLILRELKARYKQSFIGYAWVLLNPLIQLIVYSFVFSMVVKFPSGNIPYVVFLFVGLLPWIYLQTVLATSTNSLVDNSDLLRKVAFPREVLPYSIIVSKALDFAFAILILIIFIFYYQIPISTNIVYVIPIFIIQVTLMTGLALIFSASNLFYRDIQYLINLTLLVWMYLSPIIYPTSLVPSKFTWLYNLNPLVGIIEGYRFALFNTPYNFYSLIWSIFISLAILIIGYMFFKKSEVVFADIV